MKVELKENGQMEITCDTIAESLYLKGLFKGRESPDISEMIVIDCNLPSYHENKRLRKQLVATIEERDGVSDE